MSKIFSQQEVIDWYRNYANLYGRSDEEIYNLASEYSINNFGKPFKPYVAPTPPPSSNGQIRTSYNLHLTRHNRVFQISYNQVRPSQQSPIQLVLSRSVY